MKVLFVTKGSEEIGLGHIIRSSTLAISAIDSGHDVSYIAIGTAVIKNLISGKTLYPVYLEHEKQLKTIGLPIFDAVVFDMLEIENSNFLLLNNLSKITVSISPIFNQNCNVDLFFNRTKYFNVKLFSPKTQKHCGLKYTILKQNCVRVDSLMYVNNLKKQNLHIAISMGGGDAQNKTLQFLSQINGIETPTTFWVLLGEGYKHSYDRLIEKINMDQRHEIILAKTNRSMWHIVNNCSLIVLPGGITSYEATFCGIPSINYLYKQENAYLIEELVENSACINAGIIDEENIEKFPALINELSTHRNKLIDMHKQSLKLIDRNGCQRIISAIQAAL